MYDLTEALRDNLEPRMQRLTEEDVLAMRRDLAARYEHLYLEDLVSPVFTGEEMST